MGRLLHAAQGRRRCASGPGARLEGTLVVMAGVLLSAAAGVLGMRLARRLPGSLGRLAEAAWLKPTFSVRALLEAGAAVRQALEAGDLERARAQVGRHLVSRPVDALDASEVAAAAIASLAENLTDSILGPLLAVAAGGAGWGYAYRFLNTADAVIGYRTLELEDYGFAAARLDDAANVVPARLAALLIASAAPAGGGCSSCARARSARDGRRPPSPNAGWTMSAMAGALGVELCKPGTYVLNSGARRPDAADLRDAGRIVAAAAGLAAALAASVAAAHSR